MAVTYPPYKVGTLWVRQQSGLGSAEAVSAFQYADQVVDCEPPSWAPAQEVHHLDALRPDWTEPVVHAGSKEGGTISWKGALYGLDASAPTGDPTKHPWAKLLEQILGHASVTGYDATNLAGGTASQLNVTDASAWTAGQAVLVPLAAGGYAIAWVKEITDAGPPDTVDLLHDLPSAPDSSGTVYGSVTLDLAAAQGDGAPLSVLWAPAGSDDGFMITDGQVTKITLDLSPGQVPTYEVEVRGLWVEQADLTTLAPADALPTRPAIPVPIQRLGGDLRLKEGSGSIDTEDVATFQVEITRDVVAVPSHVATEGVVNYGSAMKRVQLSMTTHLPDLDGVTIEPGADDWIVTFKAGTAPGNVLGLVAPKAQLLQIPGAQDQDGLFGQQLVYGVAYHGDDVNFAGNAAAVPGNTPFRIAFL